MSLTLTKVGYLFGLVEPPILPGFEIHPSTGNWLMATGRRKEWLVEETETHWRLKQICRGGPIKNKGWVKGGRPRSFKNEPAFYVDDRNTLAFRKCGTCLSSGYFGKHVCPCPSGRALVDLCLRGGVMMLNTGRVSIEQWLAATGNTRPIAEGVRSGKLNIDDRATIRSRISRDQFISLNIERKQLERDIDSANSRGMDWKSRRERLAAVAALMSESPWTFAPDKVTVIRKP